MLFQKIKNFYYDRFALSLGILDCHFLMKKNNILSLINRYNLKFNTILDIGCSNGLLSMVLSKKYRNVLYIEGFDKNCKSIKYANNIAKKIEIASNYYVESIEDITLKKQFDLILFIDSLQYVNDFYKDLILKEVKKNLSSDGHFILYVPPIDRETIILPKFISNRQPVYNHFYPESWKIFNLIDGNGFRVVNYYWVGGKPIRYYMAFKNWIRSYSKLFLYLFFPLDVIFAQIDRLPKKYGYGMFFLLKHK